MMGDKNFNYIIIGNIDLDPGKNTDVAVIEAKGENLRVAILNALRKGINMPEVYKKVDWKVEEENEIAS